MSEQLDLVQQDCPRLGEKLRKRLAKWTVKGVYFGTSSWKYPGWVGQVYSGTRYETRGKFSKSRFNDTCITEYAETFPTVCGDFAFYNFYAAPFWEKLFAKVPPKFQMGLKVPDTITSPVLPKRMQQAGEDNPMCLNAGLLKSRWLDVLKPYRKQIPYLAFQFPQLRKAVVEEFPQRLDKFFSKLPSTWRYAVEVRNDALLRADHFAVLKKHKVAHLFNSWSFMPPIGKQVKVPGVFTTDLVVARVLLRPGRKYDEAVDEFEPYEKIKDYYPQGYRDVAELVSKGLANKARTFIAVNNRFVGNAPLAIGKILDELE